ncbi:amidase [Pelagibacterium xiamenense]|uniref:amidase n=1 Tax=Pelagibacterium xiamenense TaxID=2901140 RepID=UPI001E5C3FC3|nr:amidase [Pelagibacterium xiamenense]
MLDATGLAEAIAAGAISASDALERLCGEIAARNSALNAIVVSDIDRARMAAAAADRRLRAGERLPLLGVPITIKESFDVAGLPTNWGLAAYRDAIARTDAVAVARLRQAGAVVVGKTNVSEGLAGWHATNPVYGRTHHPLNADWTPGGSSSGAAAAVAAGLSYLDIGSDLGGSIRGPSHFCGIFGHMATHGLIPLRGHVLDGRLAPLDISSPGPMARSARDLARALLAMAGPDANEAAGYRLALRQARHDACKDFRVLVLDAHPMVPTDPSVRGAVTELAGRLANAGAKVERAERIIPDIRKLTETYIALLGTALSIGQTEAEAARLRERVSDLASDDDTIAAQRLRAATMSHAAWVRANETRFELRWAWQRVFENHDAVICPPCIVPALAHAEAAGATLTVNGQTIDAEDNIAWAAVASCCGLPATTMPVTISGEGKPLGVQIIGPYLEDLTPIALARLAGDGG